MTTPTLLVSDDAMLAHDTGAGHPECAERLRAIRRAVTGRGFEHVRWEAPGPASEAHALAVHTRSHVSKLASLRGRRGALDADTVFSTTSVDAAFLAAGAAVHAARAVLDGAARNAFALVRPPGHHAEPARAMGFCLLNNIAIAAADAVRREDCDRVLIIDWDVHHGNGTQTIFYDRSDVMLISVHQSPLFPGTGALHETGRGAGAGYTVNLPLLPGRTDADYHAVFEHIVRPIAERFDPDLLLVSAGFDAHANDPLADMELTADGFAALLAVVRGVADRHAAGRLALVLEGGYDLAALADSVAACVRELGRPDHDAPPAPPPLPGVFEGLRRAHAPSWPCLAPR
jgi:acetoin utilization deacetylase AcuC-like enzyme